MVVLEHIQKTVLSEPQAGSQLGPFAACLWICCSVKGLAFL